jgi:hypothetical protein
LIKHPNMASAIDKEFIEYFLRLDEPQKKSLLEVMKTFLKSPAQDISAQNVQEYNRELDEAMARINKGEFTTLEDLEKEMESW